MLKHSFRLAVRQRLLIFAVPQVLRMTMVLPTFAETKVGRTEGYQLQFEKPILRLHCAEPMTFK